MCIFEFGNQPAPLHGDCSGAPNPYNLSEKYWSSGRVPVHCSTTLSPSLNCIDLLSSRIVYVYLRWSLNLLSFEPLGRPYLVRDVGRRCGLKSTGDTPPICTAVPPPLCKAVPRWLQSFGKKGNAAVHLQAVLQYASHLYRSAPPICTGDTFEKIPGAGGSGKFPEGQRHTN